LHIESQEEQEEQEEEQEEITSTNAVVLDHDIEDDKEDPADAEETRIINAEVLMTEEGLHSTTTCCHTHHHHHKKKETFLA
jgi:hypothetical protein